MVTASAQREIVQILRTYVLAHTRNPKSEHCNTVCRKLVDKYLKLQDTEGDSRYVREANMQYSVDVSCAFYIVGLMEDQPSIFI